MTASNAADVLNLVGFFTGTALYAMLLLLVLGPGHDRDRTRIDRLPLATALLGLAWNLGELVAYALPRLGVVSDSVGLSAMSFPALGLLAAVVVHSVARGLSYGLVITRLAYALSASAALLHIGTIVTGNPSLSTLAFQLLTVSFVMLIVPLGLMTQAQPNGRRALWVLALVLFAVSASHLGSFHSGGDNWWTELAGHHAAIPLAFAILYQDYRFALGDLFLKQALTLLAIVGLAVAGYTLASAAPSGPSAGGLMLGLWIATALVTPTLRRLVIRFVDSVLLGRADYTQLEIDIAREVEEQTSIGAVMEVVCRRLQHALSARRVWWTEDEAPPATASRVARVPTADRPTPVIHVGELTSGRRLLSDDDELLDAVVALTARRIDAIRLTLERYETAIREEEMQRLAAEAELRALRAQINPHFLFNALTTIGYLIGSAPPRALRTLMKLTSLLRAVLRPDGDFTTLGRELDLVNHYLDIERERFEERLRIHIDVPAALAGSIIPALVVQPLVENAIKHGITPSADGGEVGVVARREADASGPRLRISVWNTGAALSSTHHGGDHVGLANVARRLAGHYGGRATVGLRVEDERRTVAELLLPLDEAADAHEDSHVEAAAGRSGRR